MRTVIAGIDVASFELLPGETLAQAAERLGVSTRTISRIRVAKRELELNTPAKATKAPIKEAAKAAKAAKSSKSTKSTKVSKAAEDSKATKSKVEVEVEAKAKVVEDTIENHDFTNEIDFMITGRGANVFLNSKFASGSVSFDAGTKEYEEVVNLASSGKVGELIKFFKVELGIQSRSAETDDDALVKFDKYGAVIKGARIPVELLAKVFKGLTIENIGTSDKPVKFLNRLALNPDIRIIEQLVKFISHNDIKIDDNGMIIAYKSVTKDLMDFHSGTIKNSIGSVISMPREKVNNDPEQTCSYGLHVGSIDYASTFGAGSRKIIVVEVDPANVVSVPTDYNGQKCRVCVYKVLRFHSAKDEIVEDVSEDDEDEDDDDF